MNRRDFFKGLLASAAAIAAGKFLPKTQPGAAVPHVSRRPDLRTSPYVVTGRHYDLVIHDDLIGACSTMPTQ